MAIKKNALTDWCNRIPSMGHTEEADVHARIESFFVGLRRSFGTSFD